MFPFFLFRFTNRRRQPLTRRRQPALAMSPRRPPAWCPPPPRPKATPICRLRQRCTPQTDTAACRPTSASGMCKGLCSIHRAASHTRAQEERETCTSEFTHAKRTTL